MSAPVRLHSEDAPFLGGDALAMFNDMLVEALPEAAASEVCKTAESDPTVASEPAVPETEAASEAGKLVHSKEDEAILNALLSRGTAETIAAILFTDNDEDSGSNDTDRAFTQEKPSPKQTHDANKIASKLQDEEHTRSIRKNKAPATKNITKVFGIKLQKKRENKMDKIHEDEPRKSEDEEDVMDISDEDDDHISLFEEPQIENNADANADAEATIEEEDDDNDNQKTAAKSSTMLERLPATKVAKPNDRQRKNNAPKSVQEKKKKNRGPYQNSFLNKVHNENKSKFSLFV